MRALIIWTWLCGCLVLAIVILQRLPENWKGAAIMSAAFLATALMGVKIVRGSK